MQRLNRNSVRSAPRRWAGSLLLTSLTSSQFEFKAAVTGSDSEVKHSLQLAAWYMVQGVWTRNPPGGRGSDPTLRLGKKKP